MSLPPEARLFALVPAAGVGARMGAALPKQYLSLQGRTLAEHTMERLLALGRIERVLVAVAAHDPWWPELPPARHARVETLAGGASRAESVLRGLEQLATQADKEDWVLVHDMARPCVRLSDMDRLLAETGPNGAILGLPATDTMKRAQGGEIAATLDRETLWRALTPQLFPLGVLHEALASALAAGQTITDEASAMEWRGYRPRLVAGRADNIKVTLPDDLPLAAFLLGQQEEQGWRFAADNED